MLTTDQHEVRVRVEDDTHGIYIGPAAIAAIRVEATSQVEANLREIVRMWDRVDVENIDEMKALQFKFALARIAVETLLQLAPPPGEA